MTGAGDAGGGAGVEAPVSARHVDPKTNPPPLAASNENVRGTEVVVEVFRKERQEQLY